MRLFHPRPCLRSATRLASLLASAVLIVAAGLLAGVHPAMAGPAKVAALDTPGSRAPAPVATAPVRSEAPTGRYALEGANPDNSTYGGSVSITPRGEVYDVVWRVAGAVFTGIGLFDGQTFSVAYYGTFQGIASLREVSPGVWSGGWAVHGENGTGRELWRR